MRRNLGEKLLTATRAGLLRTSSASVDTAALSTLRTVAPATVSDHAATTTTSAPAFAAAASSLRNWRGVIRAPSSRSYSTLPPHTELGMPALSPTMEAGNLVEWKVAEGQEVAAGDVLAEVETDKATLSWENQDDGVVAKLLVPAGTQNIPIGAPVIVLVDDADQVAAFKDYAPSGSASPSGDKAAAAAEASSTTPTEHAAASSSSQQPKVQASSKIGPAARKLLEESGIPMTSISPTGPNGIITKGDVLDAIASGTASQSSSAATISVIEEEATATATPTKQASGPAPASATAPSQQPQQPRRSSSSRNVDGSPSFTDIPVTQIRRIIAQRLVESKTTIPHTFFQADVNLDGIAALRDAMKSQGAKVSVNDCVIKAVAMALAQVPGANAQWDAATETPVPSSGVDISIAVATEAGLITPIVKNADQKALREIAEEVRELAGRARANKLKPEEFIGGSFSITNLGMYGVDSFSAIINPPQSCIMAVGGARKVAKAGAGGAPMATTLMTVTLSADARVYNGEVAAQFLEVFASTMANPYRLLA